MNLANPAPGSDRDRIGSVLCHLSGFFGFPFLLPLIVYLVKKDDGVSVAHHASEALNFHLSLLLYALLGLGFLVLGLPGFALTLCLLLPLGFFGLVCSILAAIKAAENRIYFYPMSLRFVGR